MKLTAGKFPTFIFAGLLSFLPPISSGTIARAQAPVESLQGSAVIDMDENEASREADRMVGALPAYWQKADQSLKEYVQRINQGTGDFYPAINRFADKLGENGLSLEQIQTAMFNLGMDVAGIGANPAQFRAAAATNANYYLNHPEKLKGLVKGLKENFQPAETSLDAEIAQLQQRVKGDVAILKAGHAPEDKQLGSLVVLGYQASSLTMGKEDAQGLAGYLKEADKAIADIPLNTISFVTRVNALGERLEKNGLSKEEIFAYMFQLGMGASQSMFFRAEISKIASDYLLEGDFRFRQTAEEIRSSLEIVPVTSRADILRQLREWKKSHPSVNTFGAYLIELHADALIKQGLQDARRNNDVAAIRNTSGALMAAMKRANVPDEKRLPDAVILGFETNH